MLNLSLFEIQRKWKMYAMVLFFYEIANAVLLYKIQPHIAPGAQMGGEFIGFVFLLGMVLPVLSVVDAINSLRLEIKNTSRDLYFALPYNGFEKIGSKMLMAAMSMALAVGAYLITVFASIQFLVKEDVLKQMYEVLTTYFSSISYFVVICAISYMIFIGMVYLSFALFRSFFSQLKLGGFITFGIFLVVSYAFEKITSPLLEMKDNLSMHLSATGQVNLWAQGFQVLAVQSVTLILVYFITSWLFEHRANFD